MYFLVVTVKVNVYARSTELDPVGKTPREKRHSRFSSQKGCGIDGRGLTRGLHMHSSADNPRGYGILRTLMLHYMLYDRSAAVCNPQTRPRTLGQPRDWVCCICWAKFLLDRPWRILQLDELSRISVVERRAVSCVSNSVDLPTWVDAYRQRGGQKCT